MIHPARIHTLNQKPLVSDGRFVVYWMQQAQRTQFNHALEYAIENANSLELPLIVCFGVLDDFPEANARHYQFMLEGLGDVEAALKQRGIRFVLRHADPVDVALELAKTAALLVCDRGYLRIQRRWRARVADEAPCRVIEVESDVVVPVDVVSQKHEYAARTLRPKLHRVWDDFLKPLRPRLVKHPSLRLKIPTERIALAALKLDRSVLPSTRFKGGQTEALRRLESFAAHDLADYATRRNEPSLQATSHLSPYLHFGQISPLDAALATAKNDKYIEELIVRRELSMNFAHFELRYDSYECLPQWARKTLSAHRRDKRPYLYSEEQLAAAETHDEFWNAAQLEMVRSGFMHNYMRMYWGKKILEWSKSPEEAFEITLRLNNKYEMDGRDPNSFANIAWIFGLHDRPWGPERPIFGLVRYMNQAGLERKFDMRKYVQWVETLA